MFNIGPLYAFVIKLSTRSHRRHFLWAKQSNVLIAFTITDTSQQLVHLILRLHFMLISFSETFELHVSFTPLCRAWSQDKSSCKNLTWGEPRFRDNDASSWHQKILFPTPWYLCQNFRCHIVATMWLERFHIVTHRYAASFSRKVILCEINNIFFSQGNCI